MDARPLAQGARRDAEPLKPQAFSAPPVPAHAGIGARGPSRRPTGQPPKLRENMHPHHRLVADDGLGEGRWAGSTAISPLGSWVIPDEDQADLVVLDEWLELLADDEPVLLPLRAAEYLHEAGQAGEVRPGS